MNPLALAAILANPGGVIVILATVAILTAFNAWGLVLAGSLAGFIGLYLYFKAPRVFWFYAGSLAAFIETRFLGYSFYAWEMIF
jgi:hypothetical protein